AIAEYGLEHGPARIEPLALLDVDPLRQVELREDGRRAAFAQEHATLLHELHQLLESVVAEAAAHVVSRVLNAEVTRLVRLLVRPPLAAPHAAVHHALPRAPRALEDDPV